MVNNKRQSDKLLSTASLHCFQVSLDCLRSLQIGKVKPGDRMCSIAFKAVLDRLGRLDILTYPVQESADLKYMCASHFQTLHFYLLNYYLHANNLLD